MRRETHKISEHLAVQWMKGEEGILAHGESREKKAKSQEKIREGLMQLHMRGVCSGWRRGPTHCRGYKIFRGL